MLTGISLSFLASLSAQVAPVPSAPVGSAGEDKEPVTLSPFVIEAEAETGYQATSTLAGTRLRTNLRDVAASISVATKDFMRDIGATNLEGLLTYTTGTEVNGLGGSFSSASFQGDFIDFDSAGIRSTTSNARVRGLAGADQTRDYFLTGIPMDSYNTERVEISRGPNAILFGLGSPAGIVNSVLSKANFYRNATTVEAKFDNWGSGRMTLDTNQILLPKKLAIRVNTLTEDKRFQQKPAYIRDRRGYAAVTYVPWKGATIRANAEVARQFSNKPQARPPFDNFTWWWNIGQPTFDPTGFGIMTMNAAAISPDVAAGQPPFSAPLQSVTGVMGIWPGAPMLVAENPNITKFGITGLPSDVQGMEPVNVNAPTALTGLTNQLQFLMMRANPYSKGYLQALNNRAHPEYYSFWRDQQLTNPAIFNFFDNMLEGPNKNEWAFWHTENVALEQRLGANAGIELVWDRQSRDAGYRDDYNYRDYAINIDYNIKLPNGTANPNLGRPFVHNNGWQSSGQLSREAYRGTAYYELDARKHLDGWLGRLLGRQIGTGSFTSQDIRTADYGGRPYLTGLDYYDSETALGQFYSKELINGGNERYVSTLVYLGPSVIGTKAANDARIQGIKTSERFDGQPSVKVLYYQSPGSVSASAQPFQYKAFSVIQSEQYDKSTTANYTATKTENRFRSSTFVLNSHWFDGNVVSTLGWRRDAYRTASGSAPSDPASGRRNLDPSVFYPKVNLDADATSFNYGVVAHLPAKWREGLPWLSDASVSHNKADNFQPTAQRFDIYYRLIAPQTGATKEWGGQIGLFNNKFELRAYKYKTALQNTTVGGLLETNNQLQRFARDVFNSIATGTAYNPTGSLNAGIADFYNWADTSAQAKVLFGTFRYTFSTNSAGMRVAAMDSNIGNVVGTSDTVSTGWEYEAVWNPKRNWRIALNAYQQDVVMTNIAPAMQSFLAKLVPELTSGPKSSLPWLTNTNSVSLGQQISGMKAQFDTQTLMDGATNPEVRRWHWNAVTNYEFKEGRLKGMNVGAAVRWADRVALGYPVIKTATGQGLADVRHPYYGSAEVNYDAWIGFRRKIFSGLTWKIQLNVRNIGVRDKLIPVAAQPDGSICGWRIAEPMTTSLVNTVEF